MSFSLFNLCFALTLGGLLGFFGGIFGIGGGILAIPLLVLGFHMEQPLAQGTALVLMVPNLEAANMLIKQMAHLAHADIAGIVLGAQVPVILTNPNESTRTRLASAAFAQLLANANKRHPQAPAL